MQSSFIRESCPYEWDEWNEWNEWEYYMNGNEWE